MYRLKARVVVLNLYLRCQRYSMREYPNGSAVKSVVITGSSTGIGRACALLLDHEGFGVFAGFRKTVDRRCAARRGISASYACAPGRHRPGIDRIGGATVATEIGDAGLNGLVNKRGTTFPCPRAEILSASSHHRLTARSGCRRHPAVVDHRAAARPISIRAKGSTHAPLRSGRDARPRWFDTFILRIAGSACH